MPYEIPESWEWVRFNNIATILRGGSPRPIKDFLTDSVNGINWIKIGDTEKSGKYITDTREKIKKSGLSKTRLVKKGSFLLTNSMSFGRPYVLKIDGAIHDGWLSISDFKSSITEDFLYYFLLSRVAYSQFLLLISGAVVKNLNSEKVASIFIPIPPLNEQARITQKIELALSKVDNYHELFNTLRQLNKSFPEKLRKSILQYAMQGKLVPQDETDEPVEVLLERIKEEKQRLFEEGKLKKKDLQESIIYQGDDNSYYENKFPKNWIITTICNMGDISTGNTPSKNNYSYWSNGTIPFFKPADLVQKKNMHTASEYLSVEGFRKARYVEKDSILVNGIGNIGVTGMVKKEGAFNQQMHSVKPYSYIDSDFLFYLFNTNFVQEQMMNNSSSTTIPILNKKKFSELVGVFPSLQEQKRIVSRIEKINFLIEKI